MPMESLYLCAPSSELREAKFTEPLLPIFLRRTLETSLPRKWAHREGADVANFKIEGRFRDTRGEDHYRCTWVVRKRGGEKEPGA